MPNAYRANSPPPPDPVDAELAAATALHAQARAVRTTAFVVALGNGTAIGAFLYEVLRDYQLDHRGAHIPMVTAVAAFLPSIVLTLGLALALARLYVRRRKGAWTARLAARHGIPADVLSAHARLIS